jgi:hypothetical protein
MEPIFDAATGTATITLKDGIPRKLRFDNRAMRRVEVLLGHPFGLTIARSAHTMTDLNALLVVGLMQDAAGRKENLTIDLMDDLIDIHHLGELRLAVAWACEQYITGPVGPAEGETSASAERLNADLGPGA